MPSFESKMQRVSESGDPLWLCSLAALREISHAKAQSFDKKAAKSCCYYRLPAALCETSKTYLTLNNIDCTATIFDSSPMEVLTT